MSIEIYIFIFYFIPVVYCSFVNNNFPITVYTFLQMMSKVTLESYKKRLN